MSAAGSSGPPSMAGLAAGLKGLARYFRGVLGADAYDKYLEHHRALGHHGAPLSEREFWRDQTDRQDANPQGRCC
ncbi:YbdD/YjiX family protein [Pseudarthrobacter sp. J64]|nr:YbdD/YjiX family protein [Pseudarthrobacter sp. J64]MEE2570486.1 YbdD/YjiX family protein [Pseudarthrobacter sp. J64]